MTAEEANEILRTGMLPAVASEIARNFEEVVYIRVNKRRTMEQWRCKFCHAYEDKYGREIQHVVNCKVIAARHVLTACASKAFNSDTGFFEIKRS